MGMDIISRPTYNQRWDNYITFCDDRGLDPATEDALCDYIHAELLVNRLISGSSVPQYVAAIRTSARSRHLPPPPLGDDYHRILKGYRRATATLPPPRLRRDTFGATIALRLLTCVRTLLHPIHGGPISLHDFALARDAMMLATGFTFGWRASTLMACAPRHVTFISDGSVRATEAFLKGRILNDATAPRRGFPDSTFTATLRDYLRRAPLSTQCCWTLTNDPRPPNASTFVTEVIRHTFADMDVPPADGTAWSSHCLRRSAASAMYAIGIQDLRIANLLHWSSVESLRTYIDTSYTATADDIIYFGFLLPTSRQG